MPLLCYFDIFTPLHFALVLRSLEMFRVWACNMYFQCNHIGK